MRLLIYYPKAVETTTVSRGAPANVAVGIARLGKSAFIGKVGDDPFGRFMYQTLSTENVDTRYMSLDPQHRTSIVAVGLDEQGERNLPLWYAQVPIFTT